MSRLETTRITAVLALFLALAGCSSPRSVKDDEPEQVNPITGPFVGADLYAGIPDDMIKIPDDDVAFPGEKDSNAEQVAMWATERRRIIGWCLHEVVEETNEFGEAEHRYKRVWPKDPARPQSRFDQAIAIANKVVEKIPDNTRERIRLAWCLFNKGSAEFWAIDACMNRVGVLKAKIGDKESDPNEPKISQEIAELKKTAEGCKKRMFVYHAAALRHFNAYIAAMPMDHAVFDFVWKIHFETGNFREAVRVLNQVLDDDLVKEDIRVKYEQIRKDINDYLVEREINKDAPKPLTREALRAKGEAPN